VHIACGRPATRTARTASARSRRARVIATTPKATYREHRIIQAIFDTRDFNVLTNSKKAERVVDRLLDEQEQLSFF